jgi:hypothetical protein
MMREYMNGNYFSNTSCTPYSILPKVNIPFSFVAWTKHGFPIHFAVEFCTYSYFIHIPQTVIAQIKITLPY